jgi:uncharacterized protein YndB with AHSA1/START domain
MTGITPEGIEIDRDFAAPPAAVFAAWTTAEHFARWFGGKDVQIPASRLDYEPAAGRPWSATMVLPNEHTIDWAGEFLEVVPDERLVFTMTDQPGQPARLTVTVELSPTATGTRMHMTQQAPGFTDEQRQATIAGWQTFFDVLQDIAEAG